MVDFIQEPMLMKYLPMTPAEMAALGAALTAATLVGWEMRHYQDQLKAGMDVAERAVNLAKGQSPAELEQQKYTIEELKALAEVLRAALPVAAAL